ncbi:MAG: hypothetical protein GX663_04110 [Clostridiales bacterium]|nr:hypothetical protein [Clostridiales bacterium]
MKINRIIEKACAGDAVTREECIALLSLDDASREAFAIRGAAAGIIRERNGNAGYIFGQIGLACSPCQANCSFCSFAKNYTQFRTMEIDKESLAEKTKEFTYNGDLYGLYLMTMHEYNMGHFLKSVEIAKASLNGPTKIFSNVGDTTYEEFLEMKAGGIDGVYHCWRLGEGKETTLSPEERKRTLYNARKAGLEVLDALEPIAAEHTPEEMTEHIFFSKEIETLQCGAMKRIAVPGTPFEGTPEISNFTLSKVAAAQVLTFASMRRMPIMGIHEPNIMGYMSGANMICAESGVNPRDVCKDTKANRGWNVARCRALLKEAGFRKIVLGDGSKVMI